MKFMAFTLLMVLFLGSCTIEKRLYNKGYHVEFNRGVHEKATKRMSDDPQAINDRIQSQSLSEEVTIDEIKTTDQVRLSDTINQFDVVSFDVIETALGSVSANPKRTETVQSDKKSRFLNPKKSISTDRSQTKRSTRLMKNDKQRMTKTKKMNRSEFGSELVNFSLLLVVVGLVVLGIVFPELGVILLVILVIVLVALIAWLFLEILLGILEILTFSWL